VFFIVLFLLFKVRPLAFFFSMRLPVSLGFDSLCYVSNVRLAIGRGFYVSLAGWFGGRASAGAGALPLCSHLSMNIGYSSIILAYMQINS
jgi:hypothetical protein